RRDRHPTACRQLGPLHRRTRRRQGGVRARRTLRSHLVAGRVVASGPAVRMPIRAGMVILRKAIGVAVLGTTLALLASGTADAAVHKKKTAHSASVHKRKKPAPVVKKPAPVVTRVNLDDPKR